MWKSCGRSVQKLLRTCARNYFFVAAPRHLASNAGVDGAFALRFA